ncbi:unnamed protein product [Penicillium olsonii]|uniref:Telomere replication protein EST3 n=1 Tax=Penicillium olsonii TaxID=99116 RepID=A0A9W4HHA0_PENOL|nr:unnamed protein product [Penicillium olsonii]CAG8123544.1 unnamed protein product [Penicillium olsonii]
MDPVSPWIAALAERSLSFYLGRHDDGIKVEDCGSSLTFSFGDTPHKTATVVTWGQGDSSRRATLTDSQNQIDVVVSPDSPNLSGAASPCPPTTKGGPRHLVELPELKLVFIYSASTPELELRISRFHIRQNAVPKADTPKPKLRKVSKLKPLIAQVYRKAQNNRGDLQSHGRNNTALGRTTLPPEEPSGVSKQSQKDSGSQGFHSQAAPHDLHSVHKSNFNTGRVSLGDSKELLAYYANPQHQNTSIANKASPGGGDRQQAPLNNDTEFAVPKKPDIRSPRERSATTSRSEQGPELPSNNAEAERAAENNAESASTNIHVTKSTEVLAEGHTSHAQQTVSSRVDIGPNQTIETSDTRQPSKKRHRESIGEQPNSTQNKVLGVADLRNPEDASPLSKRQRTNGEEAMRVDSTRVENLSTERMSPVPSVQGISKKPDRANMPMINHWEGMTKIPASEIEIPKDQAELLEELKWLPREPGVYAPLCHVPPRLLSQWNDIAQQRNRRSKQPEKSPEPTPTTHPQGTNPSTVDYSSESEKLSWDESSREGSPQNALPEDTPPRHTVQVFPDTQDSISQSKKDDDRDMDSRAQTRSPSMRPKAVDPDTTSATAAKEPSRSPEKLSVGPSRDQNSGRAAGNAPSFNPKIPASPDIRIGDQPSTPIKHSPRRQSNSAKKTAASGPQDKEMPDDSDDSDDSADEMEASVPFALGQSVPLSSQPHSSGSSLVVDERNNIQVVETPVINTTRRNKPKPSPEASSSQQIPSEDPRTLSSSRVRNTYCSQESQRQNAASHGAIDPSQSEKDNKSPLVNRLGFGTQTSSLLAPSQASPQSSAEVVPDSSKLTRRQRGSSIFHLESDDTSSVHFASSHPPAISHSGEIGQDYTKSQSGPDQAPKVSESPSQPSRVPPPGDNNHGDEETRVPNVELVTRRQSYLGQADNSAEAQLIYTNFCNAYPSYSGQFSHFTNMCSKLHATRAKGSLKRSFLWDDFIILNLEEYPNYLEKNASQGSEAMEYEEFFCSNFSRPQHKKRNLTARGIEVAASQSVAAASQESQSASSQAKSEAGTNQDQPIQGENVNPSFTASLVNKFSELHARSFGQDLGPSAGPPPIPAATQASPKLSDDTSEDTSDGSSDDTDSYDGTDSDGTPSIKEEEVEDDVSIAPAGEREMTDSTESSTHSASLQPDHKIGETVPKDEDDFDDTPEPNDTHHETASIELGDDYIDRQPPVSPSITPVAAHDTDPDHEPQPEQERSTWFSSLKNLIPPRNMVSTNPRWSDDPNTPFKRWAYQDQNLLVEINRRGGTRVEVDERGVILRPTYNREPKGPR